MRDLRPPARFLKRDSDTGGWVDVGDDIAREKASQVLRDAVGLLQDGVLPEGETESSFDEDGIEVIESSTADAPTSDGGLDRKPSPPIEARSSASSHQTPGLVESIHSSSSFPPPTPIESSRKRQRQPLDDTEPLLYEPEKSMESPTRRRRSDMAPETRDRAATWQYNPITSSGHQHRHSRSLSGGRNDSRPYEDYSHARHGSARDFEPDFYPMPPPNRSDFAPHRSAPIPHHVDSSASPRVRHAQYPRPYYSEPGQQQQNQWKNNSNSRPQSIASRQASTASCQSLLGDVNAGTAGEFDLFSGELVLDGDEAPENKGPPAATRTPAHR
uniref:DUF6824 domain-containing protein n=1 Tax=Entomoneis paludosa TaxID=265537 RepID=A0A7S2Y7L5_9STRA|mmetsp:Transcript_21274/g.44414  ORF Transcript_21274/g.44414 Transcript_21274/m.44414 type:complete len:329 (+) Transcript_21274:208-1194(+)